MASRANMGRNRRTRRRILRSTAGVAATGLAGCLDGISGGRGTSSSGDVDSYVFAAAVQEEPDDLTREYGPLAEWLEAETGVPTRIDPVQDDGAALNALATGQAHLAYVSGGPAWVGWQQHSLETLVVEVDAAGNAHYTAAAWVRADSDIKTVRDLAGRDSCHTGDLAGAGMLIPTAHLAGEGLVTFDADDDVTAIRRAVEEYFGNPLVGGGYIGALQCLSEGHGDVTFVRKSTPEDYCGGGDVPEWCLDDAEYRLLVEFTEVPSHPILASPVLNAEALDHLEAALLALENDADGREILSSVLGVEGLASSTSAEHLGDYGSLMSALPGIEDHLVGD